MCLCVGVCIGFDVNVGYHHSHCCFSFHCLCKDFFVLVFVRLVLRMVMLMVFMGVLRYNFGIFSKMYLLVIVID